MRSLLLPPSATEGSLLFRRIMVDNCETVLYCETLEIRRSVLCIICLSTYCNPATLPCSHTFCRHCILEASRVRLKCPICSADFTKRSLVSETHFSRVVADVVGLVNSLTSKLRYSISIDALDGFYREQQRITVPRNTSVVSEEPAQGLIQLTPLLTAQSNIAGEVNRDGIISGRREISNVPDLNFEYCTVDEESLLNRKYSTGVVLAKETIQVLNEHNHEKMEYAETSSSRSGNETYCDNLNERIYAETIDFIGCEEVTKACVYEFPIHLPCSNLQQKEDDTMTCMSSVVDTKDRDAKDVEVETPAHAVFLPGDLVTVIARMWPGNSALHPSHT